MHLKKFIRSNLRLIYNSKLKIIWHKSPVSVRRAVSQVYSKFSEYGMPFENIPRVYITLLCNLRCPYCSDGLAYDKSTMKYKQLPPKEWIKIINDLPSKTVIFTGGEPTLYPDLPEVINNIKQTNVFIYTNLAYDVKGFLSKLKKPVYFFTSFHPNNPQVTLNKSIESIKLLKKHPMCKDICSHHLVKDKSNGTQEDFQKFNEEFARNGIELLTYNNQFDINVHGEDMHNFKSSKLVECTMNRILIGPDGKRRFCVSKLVRQTSDSQVELDVKLPTKICREYGHCSPCDEVAQIKLLRPER